MAKRTIIDTILKQISFLKAIKTLKTLDVSLDKIRTLLAYKDLNQKIVSLSKLDKYIDDKIRAMKEAKVHLERARHHYENMLKGKISDVPSIKYIKKRIVLLSHDDGEPRLENLYSYFNQFYEKLPKEQRDEFAFDDKAGLYIQERSCSLFATCKKYVNNKNLVHIKGGHFLCAACEQNEMNDTIVKLRQEIYAKYSMKPKFVLAIVHLTGILTWKYEIQVPIFY